MKDVIKTVITVLVVVGCCFICLLSFGIYLSETNYMEYDIECKLDPVLIKAAAECLGNSYNGEENEGCTYYKITCTFENESNFGIEESSVFLHYESTGKEYYYVREIDGYKPFDTWKDGYYIPAGKTADFYQIISVEEGCSEFDVVCKNYITATEQRVHISL